VVSHLALVLHEALGFKVRPLLSANNSLESRSQTKARALPNTCGGGALHGISGI
jgi:hypothetical protein